MAIGFRAVEATCGRVMSNAYSLESQFFDNPSARLVSVEVPELPSRHGGRTRTE
jgi:hypothetical protein